MKAGKLGGILLLADVITGVVLGKSALDFMNRDKKDSGSSGGWKEALADRILGGSSSSSTSSPPEFPLQKTQEEWKSELTQEEYRILRLKVGAAANPPITTTNTFTSISRTARPEGNLKNNCCCCCRRRRTGDGACKDRRVRQVLPNKRPFQVRWMREPAVLCGIQV